MADTRLAADPVAPDDQPEHGVASAEPVSSLRASSGSTADGRLVARVVVALLLVGLAVLAGALFVAGVNKNAQIDRLRHHGVPVEITVTQCIGLLGGSGSNGAGYQCRGRFTLDGRHHDEALPGLGFQAPGTVLRGIAVPDDPGLVTTSKDLSAEHTSAGVFVLPTVLLVVLLATGTLVAVRLRRGTTRSAERPVDA